MASEELASLKLRLPRLAVLLGRTATRIRIHWFAAGAAAGVFLGLSAVLVLDAGVAGGWWQQLPPFRRPVSAANLVLWIWRNSGYLWERGLLLAVSAMTGGLVGLAAGRKSRAWLPDRVAEALDRLWGYEYAFTSAVVALNEREITPPAAALGMQIEERLQTSPRRSLRGVGWGMAGKAPLRFLATASLVLAISSLASFWLATHAPPSRPGAREPAVSPADSPLHSAFLALQQLADRLEAEARSAEEERPQEDSSAADNESRAGGAGDAARARASNDGLRTAAASLRQAADLLAAGGADAMPYARELVLRAFNRLLQERIDQETGAGRGGVPATGSGSVAGASRLDMLLQELGAAAGPLLSPGELPTPAGGWSPPVPDRPGTPGQAQGRAPGPAPDPEQDSRLGQGQRPGQGPQPEQEQGHQQGQGQGQGQRQVRAQGLQAGPGAGPGEGADEAPDQPRYTGYLAGSAAPPAGHGQGQVMADQDLPGSHSGAPGEAADGQPYGGGSTSSATAGRGRGNGANPQRLGDPQALELPTAPAGPLTGEAGAGPIWVTGSGRLPPAWEAGSYALTNQAAVPGTGVEREDLPLAYREWVRRYFGGL